MRVHATRFCFLLLLGFAAAAGDAPRSALASSGAAAGSLALASPAGLLDHVPELPGLPASALEAGASSTYAGYVDLPGTQRSLFYALQMSARNPEKDPLVLWLKCGALLQRKSHAREQNMLTHVLPYCARRPPARLQTAAALGAAPWAAASSASLARISPRPMGLCKKTHGCDYSVALDSVSRAEPPLPTGVDQDC